MKGFVSVSSLLVGFCVVLNAQAAPDTKVADVNGRPITDRDLESALSNFNEGQRATILGNKASKARVVDTLIEQELLSEAAEKEGLEKSQEYKDALAAFRKQFLSNRLLALKLSPKVTESAAKKYYERNIHLFSTDTVTASHILLESEAEAKDVLAKAKANGADFNALAEKFSKDPSAKNNRGNIGTFPRERMVPEFSKAAFQAKTGEIVGPVKTDFGWHVIKVTDKFIGKPMNYEEVELKVKSALRAELTQELISGLRKTAKIQRN